MTTAQLGPYTGLRGFESRLPGIIAAEGLPYPPDSVDMQQLHRHIRYAPETKDYLYKELRPMAKVRLSKGLAAPRFSGSDAAVVEDILAFMAEKAPHVYVCQKTEAWTAGYITEALILERGYGYCNELARLFCCLCILSGVNARMVFLYNRDGDTGHVVAEALIDGQWSFCDPSIGYLPPPLADGRRISAATVYEDDAAGEIIKAFPFRTLFVGTDAADDYYYQLFYEFAIYEYTEISL